MPYKLVEFDRFAVASYNAVHGTYFETMDIKNVHGKDLEITDKDKYCYFMFYSFPCFTEDTLVLTNYGIKKIKDVSVGDFVITHTNNYEEVLATRKTGTKTIFKVIGMGIDEIRCTENHKFYVREMTRYYPRLENGKRGNCRKFSEPKWVECKNLTKKHYLGIAINQKDVIPEWNGIDFNWSDGRKPRHKNQLSKLMNNHSFWWIIGRYLGDGWIRSQGGIIICCSKGETHEILPHLRNCELNYSISEERTVNKIHIPLKEIELFVEPFGRGAENKCIPNFVFDMPCELLKSLIDGFIGADGYAKDNLYKLSSISRNLIYGMAQIVAKAFKTPYRIYKNKRKPTVIIEGRVCNQKDGYELVFKTKKKKQDKAFYENGYIWFPIQSVENTNSIEDVYDIEVRNSHSFTANGVIVHNCTDISVAGKMAGMSKGSGTRSGLLWEVERILHELKEMDSLPQILCCENVPQIVSKKNRPDFDLWCRSLEDLGYFSTWRILNAKDYGVPQNRNRFFMLSFLGKDYEYEWPEPVPLTRRLKDVLEDNVDEKYYINSGKADRLIQDLAERNALPLDEKPKEKPDYLGNYYGRHSGYDGSVFGTNAPCKTITSSLEGVADIIEPVPGRGKQGLLLSRYGTHFERKADVAACLMARDCKGFGNQAANGVIEIGQD